MSLFSAVDQILTRAFHQIINILLDNSPEYIHNDMHRIEKGFDKICCPMSDVSI